MATTKGQRVGIWVITLVLLIGTIGGFIAMMLMPGNNAKDQAELAAASKRYSEEQKKYQEKTTAQATTLSNQYYGTFSEYSSRVGSFAADQVKELKTEDLKEGDGETVTQDTRFFVYYIGWNAKGEIFDQSIEGDKLKAPFAIDGPAKAQVINGWKEGVIGMKLGGVRELTIPAAKAYGNQSAGDKIPANAPLKFVVMAIKADWIEQPKVPEILQRARSQYNGLTE